MVYKDGAGAATWSGFRWNATGLTASVGVVNISPNTGERFPALGVPLFFVVDNSGGTNTDVQVQVSDTADFSNIISAPSQTDRPNGVMTLMPTALTAGTKYWWRVRGAPTGTTTWGPWSGGSGQLPPGSAISLSGAVASASTSYSSELPANAIDADPATNWTSDGSALPQWLMLQLLSAQVVGGYTIRRRNDTASRNVNSFTFQGSNDGSAWTTLDTRVGVIWPTIDEVKTFTFANVAAWLYCRVRVTAGNGDTYISINEITLLGPSGAPVASPWTFTIDLNTGKACEYSYENVGIDPVLYSGTVDSIMENVGVEIVLYPGGIEYLLENVGVEITLDSDGIDYVYENVNDLTPVPHIWFAYKKYGFVNDLILIYGQGFGALQTQYNAQPKLDWGPDFTKADISLGAQDWEVRPAMADSYGPDRRIYVGGGDGDPPFSNVETDIFTIAVPAGALPTAADGPQHDFLYVVTTGGTSNKVAFLFYPTIPVPMGIPIISMRTGGVLIVVADPVGDTRIAQPSMVVTAVPYIVVGGSAQRDPLLGAVSITSAKLGI